MSSRRYQEDIRRIVGMPDVAGGLDDDLPRMRIDGARGVFVIGSGETQSGASPGTDADGNDKDPITPPEGDGNTNEDGDGQGDGNTDAGATNPDDFIDDQDESNWDVGDDLFGGDWGAAGGTTFADCVDGTCVELVDSIGHIDPPDYEEFVFEQGYEFDFPSEEGFSWYLSALGSSDATYPTPVAALRAIYSPSERIVLDAYRDNTNPVNVIRFRLRDPSTGFNYDGFAAFRSSRSPDFPDPPTPIFNPWPADNCIQLAKNSDGQWAASPNENPNDMTAKYSEPKSSLDLCTPSGDGVQILPGADGGTVYWNYTTGIYRAVSPDGKQSFGGSSGVTQAVAGSVAGGADGPKAVGSAVPSG